jgi:serine/threonine protein kinase
LFAGGAGTGVLATEAAGHTFGTQAQGVRGKAGTPGFWAPEMLLYDADGRGARYGPAVDWWSFGCLVYAMLTARGPFSVAGGDTADDNDATLNSDPDFSAPQFSRAAVDLLQVGPSR